MLSPMTIFICPRSKEGPLWLALRSYALQKLRALADVFDCRAVLNFKIANSKIAPHSERQRRKAAEAQQQ